MMDRIVTSKPVNKTAGLVMSRGEHWTPYLKEHTAAHWENPPKCLPVDPNRLDHTGTKFGRFTVVGLVSHKTKNKKARWLVRCVCGRYEARGAKAILNPSNNKDACRECQHLEHIKSNKGRGAGVPTLDRHSA